MTVKEFIEQDASKYVVETVDYISFAEKKIHAEKIVKKAYCHMDDNGDITVDGVSMYLFQMLTIIDVWTNIDIDWSKPLECYDELNKVGAIEMIIKMIRPSEIKEFTMILEVTQKDFLYNNCSTKAFIKNEADKFRTMVEALSSPIIQTISNSFDKLDEEKIKVILEKISQKISK